MRRMDDENDTDDVMDEVEYMMRGTFWEKDLVHIITKYLDGRKLQLIWIQLGSAGVISTELAATDP